MDFNFLDLFNKILTFAIPTLFAITVHEAAHGYAAKLMGDNTAWRLGRCTLNPIPHVDKIGTIVVPALAFLLGGILFGWAKPVPIDPSKMRYPRKSPFWVAIAGPLSNFIMALLWGFIAYLSKDKEILEQTNFSLIYQMAVAGIQVNLALMIFNLLPLPPLDGSRMVERFLKGKSRAFWHQIERYGLFIVLPLMFTGILQLLWFSPWMHVFAWIPNLAK